MPHPPIPIPDTLKGVDDLIHAGLEAYRSSCFNWLLVATGLVVVGLVLEGPELWHEITSIASHSRFTRRFHFSLPESHAPNWAKLAAFVGWLFIVVGVAGEYVADSFVSKADGYVQTFDEMLLTEAQRRTAFASERASAAYERAAFTEKEAAQENERAARAEQLAQEENARAAKALESAETARKEAEGFQLQIAQSNERAANAEKQAAAANLEIAKLTAPRRFGPEQCTKLRIALLPFGQPVFDISVAGTPEAMDLAGNMERCREALGWKEVQGTENIGFSRGSMPTWGIIVMSGITIEIDVSNSKELSPTTNAFVGALKDGGLGAKGFAVEKGVKPNIIHIKIGSKQ
jgi:hypothetical protein